MGGGVVSPAAMEEKMKIVLETKVALENWRRKIRRGGLSERARDLADFIGWAKPTEQMLTEEMVSVSKAYETDQAAWFARPPAEGDRPREHFYHAQAAKMARRGAWASALLEGALATGLAILYLVLGWIVSASIGFAVAALTAMSMKGAIGWFQGYFSERPKEARDLAVRALVVLGSIAIVCLAIIFVTRGLGLHLIAMAFPIATGVLAIVLPLLAAVLFGVSDLYRWSTMHTQDYRELDGVKREITELREHAERMLPTFAGPRGGVLGAVAKIGAGILLVISAHFTGAEITPANAAPKQQPHAEVWFDATVSTELDEERSVGTQIAREVPALTARYGVKLWQVFTFTDEPWRSDPLLSEGVPPYPMVECAAPTEAARVFRSQQDDGECASKKTQATGDHRAALKRMASRLEAAVSKIQERTARCTALIDLLMRAGSSPEAKLIVVVTDAGETCRKVPFPHLRPPLGTRVAVVVVGSVDSDHRGKDADVYNQRTAELRASAPWLIFLTPWQVASLLD
jgi:hypothetical protein